MPELKDTGRIGERTIKRLPWINARDYGVRASDDVDDATQLQNVLDSVAVTGGVVVLPPGEYRLDSDVTVPSGVTLAAANDGVTFAGAGATAAFTDSVTSLIGGSDGSDVTFATEEQAQEGTATDVVMSPLRTTDHLEARRNEPNGVAGLDENGHLVGPIIVRTGTPEEIGGIVLSDGEITLAENQLIRGDGEEEGGFPVSFIHFENGAVALARMSGLGDPLDSRGNYAVDFGSPLFTTDLVASGDRSFNFPGASNKAAADQSAAMSAGNARYPGQFSVGSGENFYQYSTFTRGLITASNSFVSVNFSGFSENIEIKENQTVFFEAMFVGRRNDGTAEYAAATLKGLVAREEGQSPQFVVSTQEDILNMPQDWGVEADIDGNNLRFRVKTAGDAVRWTAGIKLVEAMP